MGKPVDFREVAAQLARPQGDMGIIVAQNMNRSNGAMTCRAIDLLALADNETVLEIGPGNGALAPYALAKAQNVRYTGADISETMLAEANRLNPDAIASGAMHFLLTDGNTLPFEASSFDKILTVNTLYFWEDPKQFLQEIKRVLRPPGIFCLAIASKAFMQTLPFTPHGFTLYTEEDAKKLLVDNGFSVQHVHTGKYETSSATDQTVLREEIFILAGHEGL